MTTTGMKSKNPRRGSARHLTIPLADWPERDRRAWEAALCADDPLEGEGLACAIRISTRNKYINDYGRFLFWLRSQAMLDPKKTTGDHITKENMALYAQYLYATMVGRTVHSLLNGLARMTDILDSSMSLNWLRRYAKRFKNRDPSVRNKAARVVPVRRLLAFGRKLMAQADAGTKFPQRRRAVKYRDGLMIALLSCRPIRRGNLCAIRIEWHLIEKDGKYRLAFQGHETKNGKKLDVPYPDALVPSLQRWLTTYRPMLLVARDAAEAAREDALWLAYRGKAIKPDDLYVAISKRTLKEFGHVIGPHLFRDCVATSIAEDDPGHVLIVKDLLGHATFETAQTSYNQARRLVASRRHSAAMSALRRARE